MSAMVFDSLFDIELRHQMTLDAIEFVREQGREPEPKMVELLHEYEQKLAMMRGRTINLSSTSVDDGVRAPGRGGSTAARRPAVSHEASSAQINFVKKLVAEKDTTGVKVPADLDVLSKTAASALIDRLVDRPAKTGSVPSAGARLATEKQQALIAKLLEEKDLDAMVWNYRDTSLECRADWNRVVSGFTTGEASKAIDALFSFPRKQATARTSQAELADGFYLFEGTYYLVQHAVHGSGHQYAKQWFPGAEGSEGFFEVARGMVRKLRPEHALSEEQAEQFGQVYGRCGKCGRTLTDKNVSMKLGIGPECRKKG